MKPRLLLPAFVVASLVVVSARADEAKHDYRPTPAYSIPYQLRPAIAWTVVRSDNSLAFYKDPVGGKAGTTLVSSLLGTYAITPELQPFVRAAWVASFPPVTDLNATIFSNPALGVVYALRPNDTLRVAASLGVTLPLGQGGGNDPDVRMNQAGGFAALARSNMDNALFAVNDFAIFPGIDVAFVSNDFTAQLEATFVHLRRVRGDEAQPDSAKSVLTGGLHVGYFLIPQLNVGAEVRHQRSLTTPFAVSKDESRRDTTTLGFGVRAHFKAGEKIWVRPALSFSLPLDKPMSDASYKILQLDVPVIF